MHSFIGGRRRSLAIALIAVGTASHAVADDAPGGPQPVALDTVTVTAAKLRSLEQFTPTGSRLGLSAQELPATLEVIDNDEMLGRGFFNVQQAADSQAGVTSGGSPGDQSQFSMRGFTGNQITVLRNGLYIGPSNMTTRDQNAFNVGSVEILKGPASVLYGQGAIAGAVNVVDKAPSFDAPQIEGLASAGSFNSTNVGLGGTTHFGDTLAIRADASRTATQGYVAHDPSNTTEATVTALWKALSTLDVQLTVDWLEDNPSKYYGTPLVPASFATQPLTGVISSSTGQALDRRMRFVNYNVSDASIHSSQYWPQLLVKWTPSENLTVQNFVYYFHAHRTWQNAETYQLTTVGLDGNALPAPQINRDRFYVFHQQNLIGDEGSVSYKGAVFGLPNTAVVGFDYSHLNFNRVRGFPTNDLVDPLNPSPGLFGPLLQPGELVPRDSPTHWNDYAAFFEDVIDLAAPVKLVTGGRYDRLELNRQNFNTQGQELANGFTQTYSSANWRVGLVYNVNDYLTPYVSWTTGKDPPGTNNIFLVNAPEGKFALSSSHQVEAGIKARTPGNMADVTFALYDIKKSNLLVQTGQESQANASQTSKGLELTTNFKPTQDWTVSANAAYTDSVYTAFTDPSSGASYTNVQPANIPRWTANLWTSLRNIGNVPLEIGGGMRYIGKRPGNTANTLILKDYALFNAYISYELKPGVLVTARGNNLFDKAYAQWADIYYPSELMLGPPRYWELGLYVKF
ncbi:MAG: TonB-dependent receptor [Gammaproteobacteria bacterium]|jgi:iron complex outermembrane receptor protein|nr:TonB-dependent receptor [Gammaproteobacteria bacterium]